MKKIGIILLVFLSIGISSHSQSLNSVLQFDSIRSIDEINDSLSADAYPWISNDGLRLYYTQGSLTVHMKFSQRPTINDPWSAPVILMSGIPTTGFTLSSNELDLFQGSGADLLHYERPNLSSPFSNQTIVNLNIPVVPYTVRSVSFDASGFQMFIYVNSPGVNEIFELTKVGQLTYNFTRRIPIPLGYTSPNGRLSCDGLTFVYSLVDTLGNRNLGFVERATPFDTFDVSLLAFIPELVDSSFLTAQASLSLNNEWIVFVRGITNSFAETNLYIGSKPGILNSVSENNQLTNYSFPNPVNTLLTIRSNFDINNSYSLKVFSSLGKIVLQKEVVNTNEITFDVEQLKPGIYVYSLSGSKEIISGRFIKD